MLGKTLAASFSKIIIKVNCTYILRIISIIKEGRVYARLDVELGLASPRREKLEQVRCLDLFSSVSLSVQARISHASLARMRWNACLTERG